MTDLKPVFSDDVRRLIDMGTEMMTAKDMSPIVRMHPSVIIKYAKEGLWPREICNYVISGNRVKFFRVDFLRKGGWIA